MSHAPGFQATVALNRGHITVLAGGDDKKATALIQGATTAGVIAWLVGRKVRVEKVLGSEGGFALRGPSVELCEQLREQLENAGAAIQFETPPPRGN